jgi:trehalose 6-phosphate synthase/phosphatase
MRGDTPTFEPSVGGLATGICSLEEPKERLWFGWPGIAVNRLRHKHIEAIIEGLRHFGCSPVHLTASDIRDFYFGFSNETLWPLFHYFPQYASFETRHWDSYCRVNQKFCDAVVAQARPDDTIWVHDYQLMLLPQMLRNQLPDASIGFFLHIPFPSYELIRLLPWRSRILSGLLGADLIAFHEYDYVRHFLSSVYRIAGYEPQLNHFVVQDRLIQVDAIPMGIDYEKYAASSRLSEVREEIKKLRRPGQVRMILSVDRLDYTKGILRRLEAFDEFLSAYPEYRGKVSLAMVTVPSRVKVDIYRQLCNEIERAVGRINGEHGNLSWTPVSYMYRKLSFEPLAALYHVADVALVTPLRDGMNLVAKEYVACQRDKEQPGVLILSEMAGAARELAEAVIVNPYDKEGIVAALRQAIEMPTDERRQRCDDMSGRLSRYTVARWAEDFLHRMADIKHKQAALLTRKITSSIAQTIMENYQKAAHRLLLLDYDGTLVSFVKNPDMAFPDEEVLSILNALTADAANEVVIISGRDRKILTRWLGNLEVSMVAEHGAFIRPRGKKWKTAAPQNTEWKEAVRPMLELYMDRTPGSFVEEKNFSLVWHCRKIEPDLAKLRMMELKDTLASMCQNLNLGVFEGHKIVEVKPVGINKGAGVQSWLNAAGWDFILAVGDDYTDEDMFQAIGDRGITCKIGHGASRAQYRLNSVTECRKFLKMLFKA